MYVCMYLYDFFCINRPSMANDTEQSRLRTTTRKLQPSLQRASVYTNLFLRRVRVFASLQPLPVIYTYLRPWGACTPEPACQRCPPQENLKHDRQTRRRPCNSRKCTCGAACLEMSIIYRGGAAGELFCPLVGVSFNGCVCVCCPRH